MTLFQKQNLYKYILPAVFTVVFTVVTLAAIVCSVKSGKTVSTASEGSLSLPEESNAPVETTITDKYGENAVFDGFLSYSEKVRYVTVTVEETEPDGTVIREVIKKKVNVPVMSVHGDYFILNAADESSVRTKDGIAVLRSDATISAAGYSKDGSPLFEISGRTVSADGRQSTAIEIAPAYSLNDGTVTDRAGTVQRLPLGFSFVGVLGEYMLLESQTTGLQGLYTPENGWAVEPIYTGITSLGKNTFAAKTNEGCLLMNCSGAVVIGAGRFSEISVSGVAACAYSEQTGWVAFDLSCIE